MDSRYADTIIKIAEEEAKPAPYGKVNDFQRIYEGGKMTNYRFGWERLKEYVTVAAKFTDQHWKIPGYLEGVQINNKRIPPGIHWCGIFATWAWIQAGIPGIYWAMPGVKGPNVKKVWGAQGISRGDIGVLKGGLVHHFIVAEIDGKKMKTINGNSEYQGITIKNNSTDEVSAYYTVEDKFYNQLKEMYG